MPSAESRPTATRQPSPTRREAYPIIDFDLSRTQARDFALALLQEAEKAVRAIQIRAN